MGCHFFCHFLSLLFADSARCSGVWQTGRVLSIGVLEFWLFWSVFSWEAELFFRGGQHQNDTGGLLRLFFDRYFPSRLPNTHFNFPSLFPRDCMAVSTSDVRSLSCQGQRRSLFGFLCRDGFHEHHHIEIRVLDLHHSDWLLDETPSASWIDDRIDLNSEESLYTHYTTSDSFSPPSLVTFTTNNPDSGQTKMVLPQSGNNNTKGHHIPPLINTTQSPPSLAAPTPTTDAAIFLTGPHKTRKRKCCHI